MNTPVKRPSLDSGDLTSPTGSSQSPSVNTHAAYNFWNAGNRVVKRCKLETEEATPVLLNLTTGKHAVVKMRITALKHLPYRTDASKFLLKFIGLDSSGEIQCIAYAAHSQRLLNAFEVNDCVKLTEVDVKPVASGYPAAVNHDRMIEVTANTKVTKLPDDALPPVTFALIQNITEARNLPTGTPVDLLAVVCRNDGLMSGMYGSYRRIFLADTSDDTIFLTLNRNEAESFGDEVEFAAVFRKFVVGTSGEGHPILKAAAGSAIFKNVMEVESTALLENFARRKSEVEAEAQALQDMEDE